MLLTMNARPSRTVYQRTLSELINPTAFEQRTSPEGYAPSTLYRIPEHQRFSVWKIKQMQRLVESVMNNLPIHAIIVTKNNDVLFEPVTNAPIITEYFNVEDGQNRMNALQSFYLDKFPTLDNRLYSQLSPAEQAEFLTYQVTVEVFAVNGNVGYSRDLMANVFERLNAGKSLSSNDKFWARKTTPVVHYALTFPKSEHIRADFAKYIGEIGSGTKRNLLSDMVGAILSLANSIESSLNASYEINYPLLTQPLSHASVENISNFFTAYFDMLNREVGTRTTKPNKKHYSRLSGVFGLAICSWIKSGVIHDAISWFTKMKYYNKDYEPSTYADLNSGDRRNSQGKSIPNRLQKIIEQWETEDHGETVMNGVIHALRNDTDDDSDSD